MATGNLAKLLPTFFVGKNGERLTEDQIKQRQAIAQSLLQQATDTKPNAGGWASIAAKGVQGFSAGLQNRQANAAMAANAKATQDADNSFWSGLTGGAASTVPMPTAAGEVAATSPTHTNWNPSSVDPSIKAGIASTANALGINPVDLATAISYETGGTFNPTQGGPTTQWGQHRGLIQFGEPQAKQYGVNWDDPINSQLGENGAVANYLRSTGVKPGMGLLDIYSAINAGGVGRYDRSDANNGGAPGTVADKVNNQMAAHRAKALALFGDTASAAPQTATDAIAAQSPAQGGYVDPMVTTAYAAPMPVTSAPLAPVGQTETVSAPTMAPAQDISPVAQALVSQPTEAVKGGRVGAPFDQGRFASPEASPVFDINAAMQPQEAAPQQASPVAQTLASQAPQQAPFSIPQPQYRTAPTLNPGVIAALRNPDTSPETRRVAAALYQQNLAQQQAVQEENLKLQQGQQAIQQRVQLAQQMGINPAYALDEEAWKNAVKGSPDSVRVLTDRANLAGLQPGTKAYNDFILSGGDKGITINNEGAVPAGYRAVRDDAGRILQYEPIPGSPAAMEASNAADKKKVGADLKDVAANTVVSSIGKALDYFEAPGLPATGTVGNWVSGFPETNAAGLRRQLATVKSNITMDSLQAARAASPTGAALGAVSDKEGELLANKIGSLDPSSPTFDRDILDVQKTYLQTVYGKDAGERYFDQSMSLRNAKKAIAKGANRDQVIKKLMDAGIEPVGL